MIPARPLFCSSLSDTAGRQDISLAASAIWSCLPSALVCRPRLLETVISKHIYYFPLPGLRGARFLLLFDDAGQRQCYFTIWIRAKGAVSVKCMAPEAEQGVPWGCLLAAQATPVRWDPMQLSGCEHNHLFFTLLVVSMLWTTTDVEWIECDCFSLWLVWYYTQIPRWLCCLGHCPHRLLRVPEETHRAEGEVVIETRGHGRSAKPFPNTMADLLKSYRGGWSNPPWIGKPICASVFVTLFLGCTPYDLVTVYPMVSHVLSVLTFINKITFQGLMINTLDHRFACIL